MTTKMFIWQKKYICSPFKRRMKKILDVWIQDLRKHINDQEKNPTNRLDQFFYQEYLEFRSQQCEACV